MHLGSHMEVAYLSTQLMVWLFALGSYRNWDFPPSDPLSHGRDSKPTAPSSSLNYTDLSTYRRHQDAAVQAVLRVRAAGDN